MRFTFSQNLVEYLASSSIVHDQRQRVRFDRIGRYLAQVFPVFLYSVRNQFGSRDTHIFFFAIVEIFDRNSVEGNFTERRLNGVFENHVVDIERVNSKCRHFSIARLCLSQDKKNATLFLKEARRFAERDFVTKVVTKGMGRRREDEGEGDRGRG